MKHQTIIFCVFVFGLTSCVLMPAKTPTETIPYIVVTPLSPTRILEPASTKPLLPGVTWTPSPSPTYTQVPAARSEHDHISGTYRTDRPNGAGCFIKVILEPFTMPFDNISFELLCNLGAPSYNSGYTMSTVLMADNLAVFSHNDKCSIVLEFREDELKVTQIGRDFDCGFGHGIYADGIYSLVNLKPPMWGCMRMDNPCNLTPVP
jgi:hypothetical protein